MVLVFREVKRVLRDDGCAWCVIGDSYAGGNYREGDLVMVPHRLALALQGDGWVVRNDVVWNKLNPMPESVRGWTWTRCRVKVKPSRANRYGLQENGSLTSGDLHHGENQAEWSTCPGCDKCEANDGYVLRRGSWRHTRAHEVVLMLVKGMGYFANQEAVREATTGNAHSRGNGLHPKSHQPGKGIKQNTSFESAIKEVVSCRNPRSVLTLSGESYAGAHYAVFPTKLIAPLIRATCPAKCCPVCGAGWVPITEPRGEYAEALQTKQYASGGLEKGNFKGPTFARVSRDVAILGYRPSCECWPTMDENDNFTWLPGIVLDPFVGSGTAGMVAKELGLRWVGLDLAHEYLDQQAKVRTQMGAPSDALDGLPMFDK
jgi:DNA modification methylase